MIKNTAQDKCGAQFSTVKKEGRGLTSMNILWIRNCITYSESMTSHALCELAGSRRTLMQQAAAGGRHGRHLKSMTSYHKYCLPSLCVFSRRTTLSNFIPIGFDTTEFYAILKKVAPTRRTITKA